MAGRTPAQVSRGLTTLGTHLRAWRLLNNLTQALVAERAGVSRPTVAAIEAGQSVSTENLLRLLRVLGVLDQVVDATDPLSTDVGRLRADQRLPLRARSAR
ncbi:MAG: helix-turn-helix domain-containing protein [Cellulomonas sp.]|nr:helix-turn-helix domain-containing protein [Cellulomonas sp.]